MSEKEVQEKQQPAVGGVEGETVSESPIYFKKKVLSLDRCKELQRIAKELVEESSEDIAQEKAMLEKIVAKHDALVARLERKLDDNTKSNIREIQLQKDDVPNWRSLANFDTPEVNSDKPEHVQRLLEWHMAMERYVAFQRSHVTRVTERWFDQIDAIKDEGESEAYVKVIEPKSLIWSKLKEEGYLILAAIAVLAYTAFVYMNVTPEVVSECTDKPGKCMKREMMKFLVLLHDTYLAFHNITLEHSQNNPLNGSIFDELE